MNIDFKNKVTQYFNSDIKNINFPDFLLELKQNAIGTFEKFGVPTAKDENWKYTNLGFLRKVDFTPISNHSVSQLDVSKYLLGEASENCIVTVNGKFREDLSNYSKTGGLIVKSLSEANKEYPELVKEHFNKYNKSEDAFAALNLALFNDGLFIYIPKNKEIEGVYHIVHISDCGDANALISTRSLILAEENSSIKIIESIHNHSQTASFTNAVTEVIGLDYSRIDYYKLQHDESENYFIGTTDINLKSNANFHSAVVSLDGRLIRNNLNVVLDGQHIEANFHGFFFAKGNAIMDNHTFVDHKEPNCQSDEVYKGIIDDNAQAVFNGRILVRSDAQKTNAYQSNKNILLNENAKINTKPQLEIYADDVKCSHGATTGYLNPESLYYLRSRGISPKKAKALLLNAFGIDVFDKIKINSLRDEIKSQVAKRLRIEDDTYFCKMIDNL